MSFFSSILGSLTTKRNPQHSESSSTTKASYNSDDMPLTPSSRRADRTRNRPDSAKFSLSASASGRASNRLRPYPASRAEAAKQVPSHAARKTKKTPKKKSRETDSEGDYTPQNNTSSSSSDGEKSDDSDDSSVILCDAPPVPAAPRTPTSSRLLALGRNLPSTPSRPVKTSTKPDAAGRKSPGTQRMYAAATFRLSNGPIDDELIKEIMGVIEKMTPGRDLDVTYTSLVDLDD